MADNKREEDAALVNTVQARWDAGTAAESDFRTRYEEDMSFLFADPDNGDQWPIQVKTARQLSQRPMLTINKVITHWLHVTNEAKENRPKIKIRPTSSGASYEAAQAFEGVISHIEYASNANDAYQTAMETLVGGGVGYWRLRTDYAGDDTFDQEVFIEPIADALSVVLDPGAVKRDGSDAGWGIIYEDVSHDEFARDYPDAEASRNRSRGGSDAKGSWVSRDSVRVAEYFEIEVKKEWLYSVQGADGETKYVRASEDGKDLTDVIRQRFIEGDPLVDRRRVQVKSVKWYKVAGHEVIARGEWAGKYIPIIRVVALERRTKEKFDRKGLVRGMKDAQRMYNYNASAAIEYGALQGKTPWTTPVEAIRGHEASWAAANTENQAYLPYNGVTENGDPIPAPQRTQPPTAAPVYMQGMGDSERQMMMSSGQYEATFSEQGNEVSGKAIIERKSQGNRVTYHYLNALAEGIRFTGVQLIDLIPRVYDTKRVIRITDEAGTEQTIIVDPRNPQAVQQQDNEEEAEAATIFNPNVGKYDVQSSVGPNYETRRQEAFDNMTQLISANPALAQVFGDIWMNAADFPAAAELAERLRNWIPEQIINGGPSPELQQAQAQIQQMQGQLETLVQELQNREQEMKIAKQRADMDYVNHVGVRMDKDREARIAAYKAETERMKSMGLTADQLGVVVPLMDQLIADMMNGPDINPATGSDEPSTSPLTIAAPYVLDSASQTPTQ